MSRERPPAWGVILLALSFVLSHLPLATAFAAPKALLSQVSACDALASEVGPSTSSEGQATSEAADSCCAPVSVLETCCPAGPRSAPAGSVLAPDSCGDSGSTRPEGDDPCCPQGCKYCPKACCAAPVALIAPSVGLSAPGLVARMVAPRLPQFTAIALKRIFHPPRA